MRTIEEYIKLPYRIEIVEDIDEGGYVASYPDLKGCMSTGETIDEAIANLNDAKREWLRAAIKDDYPIPEPTSTENYSGQFKFRMPKSLHRKLAEHAKLEGISMNQYCLYLLSTNDAYHFQTKSKN